MDKEIKKILILGIVAVIVLIAFIVIIILGPRNNSEDQYAVFPDSTSTTEEDNARLDLIDITPPVLSTETAATTTEQVVEPFINIQTDDWQDTIITSDRTTPIESSPSFTTSNTGLNSITGETLSRDDLIAQGIFIDDSSVPRNRFSYIPEPKPFDENNWLLFPPVETELETLQTTRFKSCGNVSLGSSESAIERYLSSLADTTEASCMGRAIANNCESSRVNVSAFMGAITGSVYVTERNDGVCSVGVYFDTNDTLTLCSVADSLNANLSSENQKTFKEWQTIFAKEPGKTFAGLISDDDFDVVNPVSCIQYRL